MGKETGIPWCHHTWNGWSGCVEKSAGCAHCYAREFAKLNRKVLGTWGKVGIGRRVVRVESSWNDIPKWERAAIKAGERRRIFINSTSDVFEDWTGSMVDHREQTLYRVDMDKWPGTGGGFAWEANPEIKIGRDRRMLTMDDVRARLFDVCERTSGVDKLLLTKRPENVMRFAPSGWLAGDWPSHVWLGASVEDREAVSRIDVLRDIPAAVRFLSVEPLLEDLGELDLTGIHWVIFGGESGPHARPCDLAWIRDGVRQCRAAGVTPFVKQLGARPHGLWSPDGDPSDIEAYGRRVLRDSHGGDPAEWPADLRVREFPDTVTV